MKKLKISIFIVIVLIIILIITFILIKNREEDLQYDANSIMEDRESMGIGEFSEEYLQKIDITELMQVNGCVEKFLEAININSSIYYGKDDNDEMVKVVDNSQIYSRAKDFLSEDYIDVNNIDENNITDYIQFVEIEQQYTILDIKKITDINPFQYVTYGIITQNDKFYQYKYFLITIDSANSIFAIEPLESINDISEVKGNQEIEIEKNFNNNIPIISMTAEDVSKYYFDTMKNILLYDKEHAYGYLDEEYANVRFKTADNLQNYISKNSEYIRELNLTQYKIETIDDELRQDRYLLVDQYENIYTIETDTVTDFRMRLDTYTIISDDFKETYDSADEQYKVSMNIDKWVQMLNNRDYTHAYEILDETFRNNNWGSEEAFEQYMRENFALHYDVEYTTYSSENSTYIQQINLTDITGETEGTISLNIIMQLKDNYEFVMSFSVQ